MSLFLGWWWGAGGRCALSGKVGVASGVSWCLQPAGWQKDTCAYSQKEMEWPQKMLIIGEPRQGLYVLFILFQLFHGFNIF